MDFFILIDSAKNIGIFIIVLSILIVVHEWGHFITAKKLGVKVERFSLGFGPKLYSKMHNDTEFLICAFPLGGYVKMAGDERTHCKGTPDEFFSKPVGHRSLIVLNGPVVNFVLAYISLVFVFVLGYPDISTRVNETIAGKPAYAAGIRVGDEIIKVNSKNVYGFTEMQKAIEQTDKEVLNITVVRNEETLSLDVPTALTVKENMFGQRVEVRNIGVGPYSNVVGNLADNGAAKAAGVELGDRIIEIDSDEINGWSALQESISASQGEQIKIVLLRNGVEMTKLITPKIKKMKTKEGKVQEIRELGVGPETDIELYKFGFIDSIQRGYKEMVRITVLTYRGIYHMVFGAMSAKENVTGPIGIFYIVKSAAEMGFSHLLYIVGVISASLAIFNLLPLVPLDGGHLFFLGIEKVRGKILSPKAEDLVNRIGFSLIIFLALFVFYSDFARFGWFDAIKKLW